MSKSYTGSPQAVNPAEPMSVIPQAERTRLDAFIAAAQRRRSRLQADSIPATSHQWPGPTAWYHIDGPRYQGAYQPITVSARGEGTSSDRSGTIRFEGVPYTFNSDLRSILARYYQGRWRVRITPSNARRIATWLAWWDIQVDQPALELLRAVVADRSRDDG